MSLDLDGKSLLERCIEPFEDISDKVIVVGGYKIEEIEKLTKNHSKVQLIYNKNYEIGMYSSFLCGLKEVTSDYVFVTPGDYPLLSRTVCEKLIENKKDILIPTYNNRKGHPVLFSKKKAFEVFQKNYVCLRDFINDNSFELLEVNSRGILIDIDTMDDYINALSIMKL